MSEKGQSPPPAAASASAARVSASPKSASPKSAGSPPAAEPAQGAIQVDPGFEEDGDADSAVGDGESVLGSTASVNSTILHYRKLHGRTYQNFDGAEYWGPNDERQNEQLDMYHHMMFLAWDHKLSLAPVESPQKVLDVGTGTGIWAIDFADENPSAEVIGTDLSPIQPSWVPPNLKFEIDNCELDWTYPDNSFDYIHIRGLVGCVKDWPRMYSECLRCLRPGGWLEQHEVALPIAANEGELPADCIWHEWGRIFREAGEKMGRSFLVSDHWEAWLREAGFTSELHNANVRLPIGDWPLERKWKEVGMFNRMSLEQGLEGFATYICTQVLGWEHAEVALTLMQVRKAIKDKTLHAYYPLKAFYIQKPL